MLKLNKIENLFGIFKEILKPEKYPHLIFKE
jgi:hypothetical protein